MDLFRSLHHVCVVVHDLDASIAKYESVGIAGWRTYPPMTEYTRLSVSDPAAFRATRYAVTDLDNVQLQLCEPPRRATPQREFLDRHGEGVFHLGFETGLQAALDSAPALGLDVLMQGSRPDGSGFAYFDTRDRLGVVLTARQSPPPPQASAAPTNAGGPAAPRGPGTTTSAPAQ